jgi:hypothetical protein
MVQMKKGGRQIFGLILRVVRVRIAEVTRRYVPAI